MAAVLPPRRGPVYWWWTMSRSFAGRPRQRWSAPGTTVEAVSGGREAIELLSASPGRFSLVLLDLSMPGLDGERTLEGIRRSDSEASGGDLQRL